MQAPRTAKGMGSFHTPLSPRRPSTSQHMALTIPRSPSRGAAARTARSASPVSPQESSHRHIRLNSDPPGRMFASVKQIGVVSSATPLTASAVVSRALGRRRGASADAGRPPIAPQQSRASVASAAGNSLYTKRPPHLYTNRALSVAKPGCGATASNVGVTTMPTLIVRIGRAQLVPPSTYTSAYIGVQLGTDYTRSNA